MVERCVGTGKDGLGKQLALLRRVNFGQRILHLHLLVVIGRLGLVLSRGLRSLEIAVLTGIGTLWHRSFQQRRGHCPPSIIPRLVNVAEVHVRAQSHEGSLRGNLRGRSLPSSLRPMLVIFCGNKPFSSSGHLNRWAGSWASRALVRLFRMLEDSSACSWRGQQCISPDSAFRPQERGTHLDSQFNSDFVKF